MFLTVAVSRAVAPDVRGEFVLLALIPQLGAYIATLGLPSAVLRWFAHSPDQRPELLGLSLIVSCASGVLLTALSPLLLSLAGVGATPIYLLLLGNVSV